MTIEEQEEEIGGESGSKGDSIKVEVLAVSGCLNCEDIEVACFTTNSPSDTTATEYS
jgi:hypothetical protein